MQLRPIYHRHQSRARDRNRCLALSVTVRAPRRRMSSKTVSGAGWQRSRQSCIRMSLIPAHSQTALVGPVRSFIGLTPIFPGITQGFPSIRGMPERTVVVSGDSGMDPEPERHLNRLQIDNKKYRPYLTTCVWGESPSVSSLGLKPKLPSRHFYLPASLVTKLGCRDRASVMRHGCIMNAGSTIHSPRC